MHNEIMKKFLLATLPIFIFLIFPDTIWAKDYHFPKVEGRYQIQSDGSVEVLEHRTYSFDGSFSWADIYIPLKITRKGYSYDAQIADFRISENGKPVTFSSSIDQNGKFYARWTYSAYSETRTFDISYRLFNALSGGQDFDEFYWQVIGDKWDKRTERAEFLVNFPTNIPKNQVYAFAHGTTNGHYDFVDENSVKFTVSNISPKQFVEVRIVFPKRYLATNFNLNKNLQQVLDEEKSFLAKEQWKARLKKLFVYKLFAL